MIDKKILKIYKVEIEEKQFSTHTKPKIPRTIFYGQNQKTTDNDSPQGSSLDTKHQGIEGTVVTPFLLADISKLTWGKSLASNMALIRNNVTVAAQISKAYHAITASTGSVQHSPPVVIGDSILDLSMTLQDDFKLDGATYEVKVKQTARGVGCNLAEGINK